MLCCIATRARVSETNRFKFDADQFYLKSPTEMLALFSELPEAVKNTVGVAERCNLELKFGDGSTTPPALCYPNCDNSSAPPILNSLDFGCFLSKFASGCT